MSLGHDLADLGLAEASVKFVAEARGRGLATTPLLVRAGDSRDTYRSGLVGWFLGRRRPSWFPLGRRNDAHSGDEPQALLSELSIGGRLAAIVGQEPIMCAVLTTRINGLTEHMRTHSKDYASRRGLLAMVSRRRRLLDYVKETNPQSYLDLLRRLVYFLARAAVVHEQRDQCEQDQHAQGESDHQLDQREAAPPAPNCGRPVHQSAFAPETTRMTMPVFTSSRKSVSNFFPDNS